MTVTTASAASAGPRLTIHDLEALPDPLDDTRYEIIDGELYVTTQPHAWHQLTGFRVCNALTNWNDETGAGLALVAPGVIFADDRAVAPDVVWVARDRVPQVVGADGKLHAAPDLVVEVLSPGAANEQRDREVKLSLYSRQGVREYWIVSWQLRQVEVYRRANGILRLTATLDEDDTLESPLLPGFSCRVAQFFAGIELGGNVERA